MCCTHAANDMPSCDCQIGNIHPCRAKGGQWTASNKQRDVHPDSNLPYFLTWPLFFFPYTADPVLYKILLTIYGALCILAIVARNETWMYYVAAAMMTDRCVRAVAGYRGSLLG